MGWVDKYLGRYHFASPGTQSINESIMLSRITDAHELDLSRNVGSIAFGGPGDVKLGGMAGSGEHYIPQTGGFIEYIHANKRV